MDEQREYRILWEGTFTRIRRTGLEATRSPPNLCPADSMVMRFEAVRKRDRR